MESRIRVVAVSYTVNYYTSGYNKFKYKTTASSSAPTYNIDISKETMQGNINDVQNSLFPKEDPISNYGVAQNTLGPGNSEGFLAFGEPHQKLLGFASPQKFLSGKTDILYSPLAAQYKDLLGLVMVHETGHAYLNMLGLSGNFINKNKWDKEILLSKKYNTTDHFAILKLENHFANKNNLNITKMFGVDREDLSTQFINFSPNIQKEINNFYNKMFPVFNRVMK